MSADALRYPIGRFAAVPDTREIRERAIVDIAALPSRLRDAVRGLSDEQLETPYRPDGWTVRQLVHHIADSHVNGFIRTKLALTEDGPAIKPYNEAAFATLPDMRLPIEISLVLNDSLHVRWAAIFSGMRDDQFARAYFHPELNAMISLAEQVQSYAWHSRHHVAHITALRQRLGW